MGFRSILHAGPILLLLSLPVHAATFVIRPDGSGDAPTIQAGIDSCGLGDTVLVACGTYHEHAIEMKSGVCLRGESNDAGCATIDAAWLGRVIKCVDVDSTATIEGLTLTHGMDQGDEPGSNGSGGGIYMNRSSPSIRDCCFVDNATSGWWGKGGGLRCDFSTSQIVRCRFEANQSTYGGGAYCALEGPTFLDCLFLENEASEEGGGLFLFTCDSPVIDCRFVGNRAPSGGGFTGLWNVSAAIRGCLFADNTADTGGALFLESGSSPSIEECSFVANEATAGSSIAFTSSSEPIVSKTIIALGRGGEPVVGDSCGIGVSCTDIFGNEGGDWVGCIADQAGVAGNFSVDPLLCDVANGDYRLRADSPCLPGGHPDQADCGLIGAYPIGCPAAGVEDPSVSHPDRPRIDIRPNPTYGAVSIRFQERVSGDRGVERIRIIDATGRSLRTLNGPFSTAPVEWDGLDDQGRAVADGIYFVEVVSRGMRTCRPIVMFR